MVDGNQHIELVILLFKWKKYSRGNVKVADRWRYPDTSDYIHIDYTDNTAEFEITKKSA